MSFGLGWVVLFATLPVLVLVGVLGAVLFVALKLARAPRTLGVLAAILTGLLLAAALSVPLSLKGPKLDPILSAGQRCADLLPTYGISDDEPTPENESNGGVFSCHGLLHSSEPGPALVADLRGRSANRWRETSDSPADGWIELRLRARPQVRARLVVMTTTAGSQVLEDVFPDCGAIIGGPGPLTQCGAVTDILPAANSTACDNLPVDRATSYGFSSGGLYCRIDYITHQSPAAVKAFYLANLDRQLWTLTTTAPAAGVLYLHSQAGDGYLIVDRVGDSTQVSILAGPTSGCPCAPA